MPTLFTPIRFREIELKNRIVVSPMCEYSAVDGHPQTWHLVHLGSRAVGGAALVIAEATAVEERGRISPADTGIYLDAHVESWQPLTKFIRSQGAIAGVQLAHAGRKASTDLPWKGGKPLSPSAGGWEPVSASPVPFDDGYTTPRELSVPELHEIVKSFALAAKRALAAGFEVIEIHSAHGYLLHQFLSPLTNQRKDEFGGSFENRLRFPLLVTKAVREVWPERLPLFYRLTATDWVEGGWDLEQSIELARQLKQLGVDLIDCSSGGTVPRAQIPAGPGFQVPFAEAIRANAGIATGAVGFITDARQAEEIVSSGKADIVFLAREFLRDPYWPRRAAQELGHKIEPPVQYQRAW
ncbi:MAG TPA: NADH:flavin oxidoreductase/NADH oxidase [Candidatus Dormibacteraeota bacterium]|jgi:2,4-dienoyl-CoA reductase-like NADH-dependent reductase (Old Yellow Enzyme family)|nr:NADH:flavin oxidoreductase/NADH oxidase [Candidatus Dormibacteraeota bacterium]